MNNLWCTNYSSVRTNTRFTVHTHVTLDDFSPHSDMGDSLKNILNACFFLKCKNAGVKIGNYFEI